MLIKLGIIAGVIILGGIIFATEIDALFPNSSATVIDSLKNDVTTLGAKASDSVEQSIAKSLDKIADTTSDSISNDLSQVGNNITSEITEVKESSQKIINEEIPDFNPIESIEIFFTNNLIPDSESNFETDSEFVTDPRIHETLSLSTKQQPEGTVLLQYSDSSGKTESVSVVIRTDQKEIFSGTFFISMFETIIDDIDAPYYIDMIVEHEDYGRITSSVFNPNEASDSTIYGIFSQ